MVVNNQRPFKRLKRRVTADLHDFATFLVDDGGFAGDQPFRTAVKSFVSRYARPPTYSAPLFTALMTWQVAFRVGDEELVMEVVEEDVTRSASVYCNQCRVVGWSGHPVCNKRYHFIIRANSGTMEKEYQQPCPSCGYFLNLHDESCRTCGAMVTQEELDKLANKYFEDSNFLLHGLIHSNGYGHLLTLNGREGGSKSVTGFEMMNFWDRICKALSVKKVSLMDVSKKYGMEYRLLHTITEGRTWYGNWGYEFGIGCYGISKDAYCRAVETLTTMPLTAFFFNRRKPIPQLEAVIQFYQSLSDSKLTTLKDLFSLLTRLIHAATVKVKYNPTNSNCCWTDEDVERVQRGMLKVLMAAQPSSNWVSHKALKGAMFRIASPELLHYCLKHLEGTVSRNGMSVKARCNPRTSTVEYRLEGSGCNYGAFNANWPSKEQLVRDLRFLYDSILSPKTLKLCRSQAATDRLAESVSKLLDCKQLVKDFKTEKLALKTLPTSIFVWCQVELVGEPRDNTPTPPHELIILPSSATVADLKREVAEAFKEVYAMFKMFSVIELPDFSRVDDSMTIQLLIGSHGTIRVQGKCDRKCGLTCFRTEKGTESWIVDCLCGATDDDGEPMLACDTCGIWQHTRCVGLATDEEIPEKFICSSCVNKNQHKKMEISEEKPLGFSQFHVSCKEDVSALSHCMPLNKSETTKGSESTLQSNTCTLPDQFILFLWVPLYSDPFTFCFANRIYLYPCHTPVPVLCNNIFL